jgi:hypothetical protein
MSLSELIALRNDLDRRIHRIRFETDLYYVLEKMGRRLSSWKPFFYRGLVFTCGKIYGEPYCEESKPYDYRMRMHVGRRHEIGEERNGSTIYNMTYASTTEFEKIHGIDFDRCDLEDLVPLLSQISTECEIFPDEYE